MQGSDGTIDKKDVFKYSFQQQVLPAWTPVLSMKNTIPLFFATGILFVAIGVMLQQQSNQIITQKFKYSTYCKNTPLCTYQIQITEKIQSYYQQLIEPVYFYIELTNFYQNHRLYVSSKSVDQLAELPVTNQTLNDECKNAVTNQQMGFKLSVNGTPLDQNAIANPCGLIAKSFMNDTFDILPVNGTVIEISKNGIAWPFDKDTLFKNSENWQQTQWIDKQDERLMNWMRISALPTFQKLWGIIDQDMEGNYTIQISNNYPTSLFGGTKSMIFRNANSFGGENSILAMLYIVFGVISILISLGFLIKNKNSIQNKVELN